VTFLPGTRRTSEEPGELSMPERPEVLGGLLRGPGVRAPVAGQVRLVD
jgi:hypothetical protein